MEVKEKFRLDVALPSVTPLDDCEQYDDDFEEEEDLDLGSPQSLSNYTFDETLSEDGYAPISQKVTSLPSTKSCSMLSLPRHIKPVHHLGFDSTKIMEIERENKRLGRVLQRKYDLQKPVLFQPKVADKNRPTSSVNRSREQQRIARENKVCIVLTLATHQCIFLVLLSIGILKKVAIC